MARLDLQCLRGIWARPRARRLLSCDWAMAGGCQTHPEHCPPAAGIVLQAHGPPTCHLDHVPAIAPRGCWVGLRCRRPICDTHQPVAVHDHAHKCFDVIETCRASSWGTGAWRVPRCCDTCVARLDVQWLRGICMGAAESLWALEDLYLWFYLSIPRQTAVAAVIDVSTVSCRQ